MTTWITRQVYNLFQEPVEQPALGFSIAEEKNQTVLKIKQIYDDDDDAPRHFEY